MSWSDVRDAMQAAIVSASGYTSDKVVWKYENVSAPALPYIAMSLGPTTNPGQDGVTYDYDSHRTAGNEVGINLRGYRLCTLQLEIFTATVDDSSDALAIGERVRGKLRLPIARGLMAAQGVTPFDCENLNVVPAVVGVGFRGRGTIDIRCRVPAQALAEYASYIETVSGTATATQPDGSSRIIPIVLP